MAEALRLERTGPCVNARVAPLQATPDRRAARRNAMIE